MKGKYNFYMFGAGILIMIAFYLCAASAAWDLDPGNWNSTGREFTALVELALFICTIILPINKIWKT